MMFLMTTLTPVQTRANDKSSFNPYIVIPPDRTDFHTRHSRHICPGVPGVSICKSVPDYLSGRKKEKQLDHVLKNPITVQDVSYTAAFAAGIGGVTLGFLLGMVIANQD